MSLIHNSKNKGPQTHVLIIGIGAYPYLPDGTKYTPRADGLFKDIGQLTSPPISAAAFYRTVLANHANDTWVAPLGTVDILVSESAVHLDGYVGKAPTLSNIKTAYDAWKRRCDKDPGNVAIFYFCGHGIEKDQQFLLAENFMQKLTRPADGAFNIDKTIRAFRSCKAGTKLFLVDACRVTTPELLVNDIEPAGLDTLAYLGTDITDTLIQKAAAPNTTALGREGQVSYYTKALINALKGAVAETDSDGKWHVNTGNLQKEINMLMGLESPIQGYDQRCISTGGRGKNIIRLTGAPEVPILVECVPYEAMPHAALSCHDGDSNELIRERAPEDSKWQLQMQAGHYRFFAQFSGQPFNNKVQHIWAKPPQSFCKLTCK